MSELTADQHHMLREYDRLLVVTSEAFEYLEENMNEEAPKEVQQVFEDVLLSFEQMSVTHEQMVTLFDGDNQANFLIEDFHSMIEHLKGWFELEKQEEKRQLLAEKVVPAYESWRDQMQLFVKPYIAH